ncbi:hypothetical protein [Bacteroides sp.]|uniref:hypothetical protein n=1 Tax=Bacteroides sp. TaxID=29523 RepID=UPI002A80A6EC|nr:hypothetical protein [Bacteroides sp.]
MIYLVRRTNETKGFGVDVERRINSDRKYSLSPNPITVGNLKASQITKNGSTGPFTNNIIIYAEHSIDGHGDLGPKSYQKAQGAVQFVADINGLNIPNICGVIFLVCSINKWVADNFTTLSTISPGGYFGVASHSLSYQFSQLNVNLDEIFESKKLNFLDTWNDNVSSKSYKIGTIQ